MLLYKNDSLWRLTSFALSTSCIWLVGCGGPGRIATPDIDPHESTDAAFELYDVDTDGQLTFEELQSCPSLVDAMPAYDSNSDDMLTRPELVEGLQSWINRGIGAMAVPFTVKLDGRPVDGAKVNLVPAEFLDGAIQPASGTADERGAGALKMPAENRPSNIPKHLPVMQPGLYRVEITHPSIEIPARYNRETTLGLEAGLAGQNPNGVVWELRSKKKK